MKRLHAHIGAMQSALQTRPKVLNSVGVYAAIYILVGMINDLVLIRIMEACISAKFVGVENGSHLDVLVHHGLDGRAQAIFNDLGANLSTPFQESHYCSLVIVDAACDAALLDTQMHVACFAADIGFIYFDAFTIATEFGTEELILQSKTNAMQHEPCALLSNAKVACNFVAADSVLAVSQHPSCGQPLIQTNRRIFVDGSNLYGEFALRMMASALPSVPLLADRKSTRLNSS